MKMVQLIYFSHATSEVSELAKVNEQILKIAREKNSINGLSGILLFNNKYYLQVLEGIREDVNRTYYKIMGDKRHNDPRILLYSDIYKREFEDWSMGWISGSIEKNKIFFKYCGKETFNPDNLTGQSALCLLKDIKSLTNK